MTTFTPMVTLAIPTWNRAERYLPETLQSALAQHYDRLEILISDNASTDRTEQVVVGFADPRIRYLRQSTNLGSPGNFAALLEAAHGQYLMFLNDDDLIDPGFVKQAMAACDANAPPTLIRTGARVIDGDGKTLYASPGGQGRTDLADTMTRWSSGLTSLYLCSTLFDTRVLRETGGLHSPHFLLDDVCAMVRTLARGYGMELTEPLAAYRMHTDDLTSAARIGPWCEDSVYLLELLKTLLPSESRDTLAQARVFVARMAYKRCGEVGTLIARAQAYRQAGAVFGDVQNPWAHWLAKGATRVSRKIQHTIDRRP